MLLLLALGLLLTLCHGVTLSPSPHLSPVPTPTQVLTSGISQLLLPPSSPTIVWASWTWNRVGEINPVDGTYSLDGYLSLAWIDPRLADWTDANLTFAGSSGEPSTSNFFVPWPEFVNEEFQLLNNPPVWQAWLGAPPYYAASGILAQYGFATAAESYSACWVQLYGRVAALYFSSFNLAQFPFDYQNIPISIESVVWDESLLIFKSAPDAMDANAGAVTAFDAVIPNNLYVPGFTVQYAYSTVAHTWYPAWQVIC